MAQQRIDRIVASSPDHHMLITCDASHLVTSRHISSHLVTLSPFLFGLLSSLVFGGGTPQKTPKENRAKPAGSSLWHCNDMHFEIKCNARKNWKKKVDFDM